MREGPDADMPYWLKRGNYEQALSALEEKKIYPDHIASDLYEAAVWIIANVDNCPDNCKR